jgi:hypothetical protein
MMLDRHSGGIGLMVLRIYSAMLDSYLHQHMGSGHKPRIRIE